MGYTVFTDFHHAGLLHSLIMLFEGRLGGTVYRPIGRKWADLGYWKIYDHPATIAQYLDIGGATPDGTPELNRVVAQSSIHSFIKTTGVYSCQDIDSGYYNKAITYDAFMQMHFDIVIASIPDHIEPFKRLAAQHPDKPKLIYQIGNAWTSGAGLAPNIMASAVIHNIPEGINFISYHQEFSLDTFYPQFDYPEQNIYSFVNVFKDAPHYAADWALFEKVEKLLPDWNFKSYGGQCRDGSKDGAAAVANAMRESRFVWHTKAGGDGYGHVVHNIPAVGRPAIIKRDYYEGKLADPLFVDGETCIAIDVLTPEQIVNKIEYYSDRSRYDKLCRGAYKRFRENVDFDIEEKRIRQFLENLV